MTVNPTKHRSGMTLTLIAKGSFWLTNSRTLAILMEH